MTMNLPWMSRADRHRWRQSRTLLDLGELTAQWLERSITSHPAIRPGHGPDPETTELVPALAALNRAGFVTLGSQPGASNGFDEDGRYWEQTEAVQGLVSGPALLTRILRLARTGYQTVIHPSTARPGLRPDGITVTTCEQQSTTGFGAHLNRRQMRTIYPATSIHTSAFRELCDAWQITLAAPRSGTSHLFTDLHAAATSRMCSACGCMKPTVCGDGCTGVEDHGDGRCAACIDPGVLIDWTRELEPPMTECSCCGAPYHGSSPYCSGGFETADLDGEARCERCGCTENAPCPGGCWWVPNAGMLDLCSACTDPVGDDGQAVPTGATPYDEAPF